MATKKKTKKKISKVKKAAPKKKAAKKTAPKVAAKQKPAVKKAAAKKAAAKKPVRKISTRGKAEATSPVEFEAKGLGARSGGQAGDLQGLSNRGGSDSESVDELLEEGNAFEAEAVKGVEDADDADEEEVHTHEVPEDDVPKEYDDENEQA
jgi:N utilization substance protein A